jgi:hypothetical protein
MRTLSCRQMSRYESVEAYARVLDGLSGATSKTEVQNASRIIHGRKRERSPSAALSLYPEGPKVPYRISSLGPCEPAVFPQEAPILELLRWSAAISDSLRVVQAGAVVVALDFLPFGTWTRALTLLLSVEASARSLPCCGIEDFEVVADRGRLGDHCRRRAVFLD